MRCKSVLSSVILTSAILLLCSMQLAEAQNYVTIPGVTGGQQRTNYFYEYNYPNLTQYIFGNYSYYDYYNRGYDEFIVTAADMKKAGLCAGPLAGLGMQFVHVPQEYQGSMRIFVKSIGSTYLGQFNGSAQGGYPYYYTHCIQKIGGVIQPQTNVVEVMNTSSWSLPVVGEGDTTWVDYEFNGNQFVWDGKSNIAIGLLNCRPTNITQNGQYATFMITEVNPPAPGQSYYAYPPWFQAFTYYYYNQTDCNYLEYSYTWPYLYYYQYNPNYEYGYRWFRPLVRLAIKSGVTQSYPDDIDPRRILRAGDVYKGQDRNHPKPSLTFYEQPSQLFTITYKIVGPLPSTNTVYTATWGGNSSYTFTGTSSGEKQITMTGATGLYANSDGSLNLTNATGGSYRVEATVNSGACGLQSWYKSFIVAFQNDVAMSQIRSPQPVPKKNPLNVTTPLSCQIQNVGLDDVTEVDLTVVIRTYPGGQKVYEGSTTWEGVLETGARASVDFTGAPFVPTAVGRYSAEYCATLKNAYDLQTGNDCLPLAGQTHIFEVNYNQEGAADAITIPASGKEYYANRPFQPAGQIRNNGILDGSNWPVLMEIFRLPGMQKVYSEQIVLQSVDATAPQNFATAVFPLFTPDQGGSYRACMTLKTNDPEPANDQVCYTFTVLGNMEGKYTIGLLNGGKSNNYATIDQAVSDLYRRGVSGPVTFELTDASYTLSATGNTGGVALDLTGYISGMSGTNTVTFQPSLERSLTRGSIEITLNSTNGIGVLFGQNLMPTNQQALGREFPTVRAYSNSAGNFIFDGGSQKSIRVTLKASTEFRAPFYLGDGSQSIKLRNMIIGNAAGTSPSYANSLPRVLFTNGQFTFEADQRSVGGVSHTYSGGIVDRNKVPVGITGNNSERLDTTAGSGNEYSGNEISGFGYGIVSLGIGTLLKGGVNEFRPYYSTGTQINHNVIYDVGRAGIAAGYQDKLQVKGNRIYGVGSSSEVAGKDGAAVQGAPAADDAMGILLGGVNQYNVQNAVVSGNEISGIRGTYMSRGIVIEQVRNAYQSVSASGGMYYAPSSAERTLVTGNTVWGLSRGSTMGNLGGIHLLTGRNGASLETPASADYFTRGDTVANNTVVMTDDKVQSTSSMIAGIAIQHGNGTVVVNNAIAMLGSSTASKSVHAGLLYQGTMFRNQKVNTWYLGSGAPAALVSNYNAYYTPQSSVAYMMEISAGSEVVWEGTPDEFLTMDQWRNWTGQDISSVTGNFVSEFEYQGVAPAQKLRVKITPQPPIGSVLNDRGIRLSSVKTDIDGQTRGAAGLGYDIGADEFDGRSYVSDLESIDILSPKSYKASSGITSDAEYIMTAAPVDVSARIRNNGGLPRTGADIRVRIWLESPVSNNNNLSVPQWNANPVVDRTYKLDLNSGASADITFGIQGFTPQTYQQLPTYAVPGRFSAMSLNVTPRYRVEVTTPNDQNNANNSVSKVLRFFIKRALTSIIVSGRNVGTVLGVGSSSNEVAARLNSDSLLKGLNDLGFYNNPAGMMFSYDVMDRSAWEPRAVDYTIYRTLFWSHDQNGFSISERNDLRNFVAAGTSRDKKNLAVGSQEPTRKHIGNSIAADENFVHTVLRAAHQAPGTPLTPNYDGKKIVGRGIARNTEETISKTSYAGDASPQPALVKLYSDGTTPGIALASYSYKKGDRSTTDSIAGSATASLTSNRVFLGVDWRHYGRTGAFTGVERVLRGVIDFFETNGGTVVPVELLSFDARGRGSDADVFWSTASEQNADHFAVERRRADDVTAGDAAAWSTVATVAAAGSSTERRDYSIVDRDLSSGLYQYRLVSADRDGSQSRSGIVEVLIGSDGTLLSIESVQPNPVRTTAVVTLQLADAGTADIAVVDMQGKTVARLYSGTLPQGISTVDLSAAPLASGTYTVVATVNGQTVTTTISIVK
ncbi:MAG: T9SS type A sorting domain-containing protein [Candidatus Kapaibacterium sp.]|nr:MAG: T9SS type A sorting domain-containing protein [Candidatus Kapabacteria bacterium]